MRNATSVALHAAVDELNEPSNVALPCAFSGTSGVSMTVGLAEPCSLDLVNCARRPDRIAAGKDKSPYLEHDKAAGELD